VRSPGGRVFQSAFSAAFRALGDIVLVTRGEKPDYILDGVVLCSPSCDNVLSYSVSLRFYSPLSREVAVSLANPILNPAAAGTARAALMLESKTLGQYGR